MVSVEGLGASAFVQRPATSGAADLGCVFKKASGSREEMIGIFRTSTHSRDGLIFGNRDAALLLAKPPFARVTTFSVPPFCD